MTNFIQRPLPPGSKTGASGSHGRAGALGYGQRVSYAISTFKQFFFYTTPLLGAYLSDAHWGRFKTILICTGVGILAHIIIVIAATPRVIFDRAASLSTLIVGVVGLGLATGGVKSNLAPFIVEQLPINPIEIRDLPSGERVLVDPTATVNRVYMLWYMFTNIGAGLGILTMPYVEKYRGFWLAWLVPTILYLLCPLVMLWGRRRYTLTPPTSSVLSKAIRLIFFAQKSCWSLNPLETWRRFRRGDFWDSAMPSSIEPSRRPAWMTFDDAWVREIRREMKACSVFVWYLLFFLCFNQINGNLVSQAATLELHGLPNEFITVIDPISIIVLVPLYDRVLFPYLRKHKINVTPIRRITAAFFCGASGMVWATVLQYYIYQKSPCGHRANKCSSPAPISIGTQAGIYVLVAMGEVLGNTTILEYAFTKAPRNMRSMVQALALFSNAVAGALGQALVPLSDDPLLVWNYAVAAILAFCGGCIFWFLMRGLDHEEDELNALPEGAADVRPQRQED